jgi:hypothetical protein
MALMYILDDSVFQESKNIALGIHPKKPMALEFSEWFMRVFSIDVLNFQFYQLQNSRSHCLCLIIMDYESLMDMRRSPFKSLDDQLITAEFRRLALKYEFATHPMLENLVVTYCDFLLEVRTEANWRARKEVNAQLMGKFPAVWNVVALFDQLVVFYYTDDDIVLNEKNGNSTILVDDYYSILKKFDELHSFSRDKLVVKFDSKENLDKNFEGNLFYYTR